MKIRAFRGKWLSRKKRKYINNLLRSAKPINREELEKEAKEFEEYMLQSKKKRNKELILKITVYGTNPGSYLKITDKSEDTEINLPREEVLKGIRIKEVKKYWYLYLHKKLYLNGMTFFVDRFF